VIVSGLPLVGPDHAPLLVKALNKFVVRQGLEDTQLEVTLGAYPNNMSGGHAYLKFSTPEKA